MQTRANDRNAVFAKRVRYLRRRRGLTQSELGHLIKIQSSYPGAVVSGWERNTREPSFNQLCRLASLFGVTTDFLLGRDRDKVC